MNKKKQSIYDITKVHYENNRIGYVMSSVSQGLTT